MSTDDNSSSDLDFIFSSSINGKNISSLEYKKELENPNKPQQIEKRSNFHVEKKDTVQPRVKQQQQQHKKPKYKGKPSVEKKNIIK